MERGLQLRALVTGVAGFVGSSLAEKLLQDGWEVWGVDALTDYYDPVLKRLNLVRLAVDGFTFVEGDLLRMDLSGLLEGIDVVFHQAGQPGVRASWGRQFSVYTDNNVGVTQRLLEAVRDSASGPRVVYASSSSIYGDAERYPTLETDRPMPVSPYGVTKLAAEHLCGLYARNFGVQTVSLRYFTVYGPRQRPDMAFTRFVRAAISGGEIELYGSGDQIRDFTYIDDVVAANVLAATSDVQPGSVFNVAGGTNISVNDVLSIVANVSESRLQIRRMDVVKGDVFRTGGSSERARELLGWYPTVRIEEGIRRQFEWAVATSL